MNKVYSGHFFRHEIIKEIVRTNTTVGQKILNFYSGNGEILLGCFIAGRQAIGYEVSERNIEHIKTIFEKKSLKTPIIVKKDGIGFLDDFPNSFIEVVITEPITKNLVSQEKFDVVSFYEKIFKLSSKILKTDAILILLMPEIKQETSSTKSFVINHEILNIAKHYSFLLKEHSIIIEKMKESENSFSNIFIFRKDEYEANEHTHYFSSLWDEKIDKDSGLKKVEIDLEKQEKVGTMVLKIAGINQEDICKKVASFFIKKDFKNKKIRLVDSPYYDAENTYRDDFYAIKIYISENGKKYHLGWIPKKMDFQSAAIPNRIVYKMLIHDKKNNKKIIRGVKLISLGNFKNEKDEEMFYGKIQLDLDMNVLEKFQKEPI